MIEVVNRQRGRPIECGRWARFAGEALEKIGVEEGTGATVAFVSDRTIRSLNKRFRGRDTATDVLSFPSGQEEWEAASAGRTLGDVVVSVERAAEQAAEHGLDFDGEVAQLILHGLLHLCGYDHETDRGQMNALELRLRRRLGI
jgi:probable rRNA maturation factor